MTGATGSARSPRNRSPTRGWRSSPTPATRCRPRTRSSAGTRAHDLPGGARMRLRLLLAFAAPLAVVLYLLHFNREFVSVRFSETLSLRVPMAVALLGAALAGALAAALLGWGEAALRAFAGWKER